MLLQFEVIVSSNIRRKKPWPRIRWIGKQKESVCLLDKRRASILYLPSGRTKRVIGALKSHMKNVVYLNTSTSGAYTVALLLNGQIVRWSKDSNNVVVIPACKDFTPINTKDSKKINLFISDDGQVILLIIDCSKINVWEQQASTGAPNDLGEWSMVDLGLGPLKSVAFKETAVDAMFFTNQTQGQCCLCTFVCNNSVQLVVCNILLHWHDELVFHPDAPSFTSSVSYRTFPLDAMTPPCKAIRIRGAYLAKITHDAQTVAIVLNQRQPCQTQMLFLHPYSSTAVASDLKSLGSKSNNVLSQFAKTYWVTDMAWTSDDLFLACMTGRGSMFLLSKLGHPLIIATHKQGIEFGPALFIPLLPLIEHDKKKDNFANPPPPHRPGSPNSLASSMISEKSWRQRFSITAHPRLPILLCSDGYIVIALQITEFVRPRDVATLSLVETNRQLRKIIDKYKLEVNSLSTPRYNLPTVLFDEVKFREHRLSRLYARWFKKKKPERKPLSETQNVAENSFTQENEDIKKLAYKFEEEEAEEVNQENSSPESPDEAEDKENMKKPSGAILNADEGKISFADLSLTFDPHSMEESFDASSVDGKTLVESLKSCITKLCSTWGLIVSERTQQNGKIQSEGGKDQDKLHKFFMQSMAMLCSVLNECQQLAHCLPWSLDEGHHHDKTDTHVREILSDILVDLAEKVAALTAWDLEHLPLVVETLHTIIKAILVSHRSAPEGCTSVMELSENFSCTVSLLLKAEEILNHVYNFHESDVIDSKQFLPIRQSYHSLDVVPMQNTLDDKISSRPLLLFPIWKQTYRYMSDLFNAVPNMQINPSMQRLLSFMQRLLMRSLTQSDLSPGLILPTVKVMIGHLTEYQLDSALDLASTILTDHLNYNKAWKVDKWQAVELLCCAMTSYFTNQSMRFVTLEPMVRSFEVERKWVTSAVRTQRLSNCWTAAHAVSLLLCSGRIQEASRLAMGVGDWRCATVLSAISDKVRALTEGNQRHVAINGYQGNGKDHPCVLSILQDRFKSLITCEILQESTSTWEDVENVSKFDPEALYPELVDLFLVAVMTGSDLASWAAKFTLGHLKDQCRRLSFLVDPDTYLPAPPLYLPQPTPDEHVGNASSIHLRQKISALLRLSLVIFHSIGITEEASSWYIRKLEERSKSPNSTSASQTPPKSSSESLSSPECQALLSSYREVCSLMWALYVREQVSLHSRRYQVLREAAQPCNSSLRDCLSWIERIRPFAKFLQCEAEMQDIVLCLVSGMNFDFDVATTLATYFYDSKLVEPKVATRYKQIMSKMRKVTVPVHRLDNATSDNNSSDAASLDQHNMTMQPLTVFYQRECRSNIKQYHKKKNQHIFMKQKLPLDGTGASSTSMTLMSVDEELVASNRSFPFESDHLYHQFIAQLFDIILDKSVALRKFTKSGKKIKKAKMPHKLLVLGNRFQIASEELNSVADVSVSRLKKFSSRVESRISPEYFSTPKSAIKKTSSMVDVSKTPSRLLQFKSPDFSSQDNLSNPGPSRGLYRYFSLPEVNETQADERLHPLPVECPTLEQDKVPPGMRNRLKRLSSYANWLELWSEKYLPSQSNTAASAMRLTITKDQLLTGLVVAELRFGTRDYFKTTGTGSSNSDRTSQPASDRESEDDVTTVSSIDDAHQVADKSDAAISKAVSEHLIADDDGEKDDNGEVEAVDEVDATIVDVTAAEDNGEEDKDSTTKESPADEHASDEKDATLRTEDLLDGTDSQAPESVAGASSVEPDGGGLRKPKPQHQQPPSSNESVAGVVRSEIQNVLLAQQVSLLSQILLGQTMIASQGGATQPGAPNPILNGVLQSLVPGFSLPAPQQAPSAPQHQVEAKVEEPPMPPMYPQQTVPRSPEKKFAIPLFHVPGITKSLDQKSVNLQKTPNSRQAWASSTAAKKTRYEQETSSPPHPNRMRLINLESPNKPLLVKDLGASQTAPKQVIPEAPTQLPPKGHKPDVYSHHDDLTQPPPQNVDPAPQQNQNFLKFPSVPRREQAYRSHVPGPAASGAYRTQFPILQTDVAPPTRPQFQQSVPRRAWSAESVPAPFSRIREIPERDVPQLRRELVPRLIDPREVLAYEGRKQGFKTVAKSNVPSSRAPPVPMMQVKAPLFESRAVRESTKPSIAQREIADKENMDPDKLKTREPKTRMRKTTETKQGAANAMGPSFEGYLDQDAINREVEQLSGSDTDGMMTPADAHFIASVGKRVPVKPRMKDAQLQAVIEEVKDDSESSSKEEEQDYRDRLTTKPLKPPPDIFLKLRLETDVIPSDVTEERAGFLHVGDVSVDSVKRGIPKKMTPAEVHYRSVSGIRPEVTPYAPGFPPEPQPATKSVETILSDHVKEVNRVREVREVTRERWTSGMQQMGAQLDAIDAMAKKMNDDFKSSERLVQTIDTLSDVMAPTSSDRKRSPPSRERSLSPVVEERRSPRDKLSPRDVSRDARAHHVVKSPRSRSPREYEVPRDLTVAYQPMREPVANRYDPSYDFNTASSRYRARLEEAYKLSTSHGNDADYSDIGDHVSSSSSAYSYQLKRDQSSERDRPYETPHEIPTIPEEGGISSRSFTSSDETRLERTSVLRQEELVRALIEDKETSSSKVKPWNQRSDEDKQKIRRWMEQKRRERTEEYQSRVRALREAESKPFKGSSGHTTQREIEEAKKKREIERRRMLDNHHKQRVKDSMSLMKEIKSDKPTMPSPRSQAFAKSSKTKRSPLKEANGQLNTTYRTNKRITPYKKKPMNKSSTQGRRSDSHSSPETVDPLSDVSLSSVMSTWHVSDDVRRLLYGSSEKRFKGHVTFDLESNQSLKSLQSHVTASRIDDSDVKSCGTESLLGDVDWNDVDAMISSVDKM
uniref:Uncharacterized protein LOC100176591 n=1 Tax=Phallusia mammillata TaxID=59560 RepID=A0A6F9DFT8_9ASCI|nr:uncharacterized protein LOC100176591 [Phallusia mammillata]